MQAKPLGRLPRWARWSRLRTVSRKFAAISLRPDDLVGLIDVVNVDLLLCCEGGDALEDVAEASGARVWCLENELGRRRRWRNSHVEHLARTSIADLLGSTCIVPYAAATSLLSLEPATRIIAITPALKAIIDDKFLIRQMLAKAGVAVPTTVDLLLETGEFDRLARLLGCPFVVQPRTGSAGEGVVLVSNSEELANCTDPSRVPAMASSLEAMMTVNAHGVVLQDSVRVFPPTLQITGIAEFSASWGAYCGNDGFYDHRVDPDLQRTVRNSVTRLGHFLRSLGYRGVFGVDLAVGAAPDEVRVLEVNPRFQGSTWLVDRALTRAGLQSIASTHLDAFEADVSDVTQRRDPVGVSLEEGFVLLRASDQVRLSCSLDGGYKLVGDNGAQTLVSAAAGRSYDLELRGSPSPGVVVEAGGTIARAVSRRSLTISTGRELSAHGAAVVQAAYSLISAHKASLETDQGSTGR